MPSCLRTLTIEWLHLPVPLVALLNHSKIKRCCIGDLILVYGCDINEIILIAHGLSSSGQCRTVIVIVLHLNGYGPCGGF